MHFTQDDRALPELEDLPASPHVTASEVRQLTDAAVMRPGPARPRSR
ncbi:hypothetical protein ACIBAG_27470 [Streptomyces sp. NPDC051243]